MITSGVGGTTGTDGSVCGKCGAFGDLPHAWTEGDCVLPHRLGNRNHIPAATIGFVCEPCIDRHREWLTEITELYSGLELILEIGPESDAANPESKRPKKRPASPAPIRLEAWAMIHDPQRLYAAGPRRRDDGKFAGDYIHNAAPDVWTVLTGWVDWLYDSLPGPRSDTPATVTGLCNALHTYADRIPALLDTENDHIGNHVDDYDAELRWLRTALRRVHNLSDPRPVGDCLHTPTGEDCTGHVWRNEDPTKPPKCDRCAREYTKQDLLRMGVQKRLAEKAKTA